MRGGDQVRGDVLLVQLGALQLRRGRAGDPEGLGNIGRHTGFVRPEGLCGSDGEKQDPHLFQAFVLLLLKALDSLLQR